MGPENVDEFGPYLRGEPTLRDFVTSNAEPLRHVTGEQIAEAFGDLVTQIDKDVLTGGCAGQMAAPMRRALAHEFDGWIDDDLAFTRDWDFDLADIGSQVTA